MIKFLLQISVTCISQITIKNSLVGSLEWVKKLRVCNIVWILQDIRHKSTDSRSLDTFSNIPLHEDTQPRDVAPVDLPRVGGHKLTQQTHIFVINMYIMLADDTPFCRWLVWVW